MFKNEKLYLTMPSVSDCKALPVIFSKEEIKQGFGSPETVVKYLGRYTHQVAISNARIQEVTKTHVILNWCDRQNGYEKKSETISGLEFLKRFLDYNLSRPLGLCRPISVGSDTWAF